MTNEFNQPTIAAPAGIAGIIRQRLASPLRFQARHAIQALIRRQRGGTQPYGRPESKALEDMKFEEFSIPA